MTVIDGWVKRESSPVKNRSACQEATVIGCHSLSESECTALKGRPSKSKFGTEVFSGNGQVVILHSRLFAPRIPAAYVLVTRRGFPKNPGARPWRMW